MSKNLKPHPLAEKLPPMTPAEFEALKADIAANGQREPIILLDGMILDGRHRYRACVELNQLPAVDEFRKAWGDPADYVISKANHRNMTESQKACAAVGFMDHYAARAKARQGKTGAGAGDARDDCGRLFGVSGRYVSDAKMLLENNEKLYRAVFEGRTPIAVAAREVRRIAKAKAHKATVKRLVELPPEARTDDCRIVCLDRLKFLQSLPDASARLIFADPPYNIGVDYGDGTKADRMPHSKWIEFTHAWIDEAHRVLTADGAMFILCNAAMLWDIESMLRGNEGLEAFHRRNVIVWHETFGNYEAGNFSQCWRPILYYTRHPKKYVWHGDQILIESDRLKQGDARANPAGKVPSNVWQFPRLVDNAAERMPGFPTQIPQALVERIVRVASDPGDLVVDPFVGSGTTAAAAVKHHRRFAGCDLQPGNVKAALARVARTINERGK